MKVSHDPSHLFKLTAGWEERKKAGPGSGMAGAALNTLNMPKRAVPHGDKEYNLRTLVGIMLLTCSVTVLYQYTIIKFACLYYTARTMEQSRFGQNSSFAVG